MHLKPSDIRFSQDSINNRFDKRSNHSRKTIGETLDDLCEMRCRVSNIPNITVVNECGEWITADNRRLWVFRQLERLGKCDTIPVRTGYSIPDAKRTSKNRGASISVRRNPGGFWHQKPSVRVRSADKSTRHDPRSPIHAMESNLSRLRRLHTSPGGIPYDEGTQSPFQTSTEARRTVVTPALAAPRPNTALATPRPNTALATPRPNTALATPQPNTALATPRPNTALATPQPNTALATPRPNTALATPRPNTANVTPQPNSANVTPRQNSANVTPRQNTANVTPQPNSANVTPRLNTANVTPRQNTANITPQPNSANVTPRQNTANVTPQPNSANVTQRPNTANVTPKPNSANVTPRPSTANITPTVERVFRNFRRPTSGLDVGTLSLESRTDKIAMVSQFGTRVARYTYGIRALSDFVPRVHPEGKKGVVDGRAVCHSCFDKHVAKRELIEVGHSFGEKHYFLCSNKPICMIQFYRSDEVNPVFVDEASCTYIGTLQIDLRGIQTHESRGCSVEMVYDGTELCVEARVETIG